MKAERQMRWPGAAVWPAMSLSPPTDLDERDLPLLAAAALGEVGGAVAAMLTEDGVDTNVLDLSDARHPEGGGVLREAADRQVVAIEQ